MATNQVKGGDPCSVTHSNASGSDIAAGDSVVLASTDAKNGRLGVALVDIADGSYGAVAISGCWRFPKLAGAVIAQGESVTWDASGANIDDNAATPAAGDLIEFGMADHAAGNGTTSIDVWIETPGTYNA